MRNLKKFLALVLALVMALSLVTVANANVAYKDSSEVDSKYAEAVDVLSGMKIFVGDSEGFRPGDPITRAEVAAILYRAVGGQENQVSLYKDYNRFDDVTSDKWYAGYVNYCANATYLKGVNAEGTLFNPSANVTGYEVLAMILRAVGYDVNGEFTGSNWQIQVASTAKELGITDTVSSVTLGSAASREVVAELLFRTITRANIVKYTPAFGYQTDYVIDALSGNTTTQTLGKKFFGLTSKTSYVIGNAATGETCTKLGAYGDASTGAKFAIDTTLAQFGHQFKVWYDATATNAAGAYNVIYATYDQATNTTITDTEYGKLSAAAKKAYVTSSQYHDDFTAAAAAGVGAAPAAYNIVVNNNDGTKALVGIYLTVDQYTAINNYASTKTVTLESLRTQPQSKVEGFAGLNLGAYVNVVTVIGTDGSGKSAVSDPYKYVVSALGTTVGTVSYIDAATKTITLNGSAVKYSYDALVGTANAVSLTVPGTWKFNVTYTVYTDILGNYVAAQEISNVSYLKATYAYFLHDNQAGTVKYYVQGVDTNGTVTTVQLKDQAEYAKLITMDEVTYVDYTSNTIVDKTSTARRTSLVLQPAANGTYTIQHVLNDGDCSYETHVLNNLNNMDTIASITNQDNVVAYKNTVSIGTASNYFFTTATKFIFVSGYGDGLTVTIKTGLADLIGDNASYTIDKSNVVAYHPIYSANINTQNYAIDAIIINGIYAPTQVSNLIYIPGTGTYGSDTAGKIGTNAKGDVYDAYVNGVKAAEGITVKAGTTLNENTFYTYTVSNGVYTLTKISTVPNTPATVNSGSVTHAAGTSTDYVLVNGTQYAIAANAVIVTDLVSGNKNAPATAADLVVSAEENSVEASVEIVNNVITVVYITKLS